MILRGLASLLVIGLLGLNWVLPSAEISARGREALVRADIDVTSTLGIGRSLPEDLELFTFDGRRIGREDLLGHRVLLTFERSVDW
jgi:hypothetical protein